MIPGQPPVFQLMKFVGYDKNGGYNLQPVAGAPTVEGCEGAAKQLGLTQYLIVCTLGIKSTLPVPKPSILDTLAPNAKLT
jgi:hypothetical protein